MNLLNFNRTKYYFHGAYVDNSPNTLIEAILADCVPIIFSDCEGALEYSSFAKERFIVNSEDYSIIMKRRKKKDSITFDGNFSNLFNQLWFFNFIIRNYFKKFDKYKNVFKYLRKNEFRKIKNTLYEIGFDEK